MHGDAGLHLGGLGDAGGSGALQSRLGLHHFHLHRRRQLHPDGLALEELHLELQVGRQVTHRVAQYLLVQVVLLVGGGVHEDIVIAFLVEELDLLFVQEGALDKIFRAELVLDHCAALQAAQLGLHKAALVPRRAVCNLKNGEELAVMPDDRSRTQLGGLNRVHCLRVSPSGWRQNTIIAAPAQLVKNRPRRLEDQRFKATCA